MYILYLDEYEPHELKFVTEENGIIDIVCYGGSPVEISGDYLELTDEVVVWLNENVEYFDFDGTEKKLIFRNDNDAMLFKLAWL